MAIPDLKTIIARMTSDVNHYIPGAELRPRFSVLGVLVQVYAAAVHALYQFAQNLLRNILPSTCHDDWLPAWAYVLKKPRKVATAATGQIRFVGESSTDIPAGTLLQAPAGIRYQTLTTALPGETVEVVAITTGYAGNTQETLTLTTPISGIESTIILVTPLQGGADQETLTAWRTRLVNAFANRAQIGDADDYAEWAIDSHPAIQYAWVYGNTPQQGDITVVVATGNTDPIPDVATLVAANEVLDRLRNVGCHVLLLAPNAVPVVMRILHVPEDQQATVQQALLTHISSLRNSGETLYVADLHAAIRTVYSGVYSLLEPMADITAGERELITLGGVAWQ